MLDKNLTIDRSVPIPMYYQLKSLILKEIKDGSYQPDDPIPTENEISEMFNISRTTVRQAMSELVQEGWLYRIKSKGTFVARPKIKQDFIKKVESFESQIRRSGMTPSTEVLELSIQEPTAEQMQLLHLAEGDKVIFLYRKRSADDQPIVLIKTYLPYKDCGFILENHDLEKESLYNILSVSQETAVVKIDRVLEATEATREDAKYLEYKEGRAIHHIRSLGYNIYGKPIELSIADYRGDRTKFEVTVYNTN